MIARLFLFSVGLVHLCVAQRFEVASVRASQFQSGDGEGNGHESIQISPDGLTMRNVTLRSCISWAYSVQDSQITGALGPDRFDITAKAATPTSAAIMRSMLGTLLADRFKLELHRDTKELSSLVLVVAKEAPKLRTSQEDAPG